MTATNRPVIWLHCIGFASITLALSGCNNGDKAAALPSPTDSATSVPSSANAVEKEAVRRTYADFVTLLDRVDHMDEASRSQQLRTLVAEPQLSRILAQIKHMKANNQGSYGTAVVHIQSVVIDGNDAVLRDCQDSSNTGLLNAETKKKINRGVKEERVKAYLSKADGRWRVTKMVSLGKGC